ncbi:MAG: SulP family inorganic anion transporter, partial [Thermoleophilia bacterium]|nr:SulP family inorganic anion transporter [Thermoleophilia bacterium]
RMSEERRGADARRAARLAALGSRATGVVPALKGWARSIAVSRGTLGKDAVAGLPGAVGSVPDGMAASVLAGVNPIHGLYASFAGPIFGGLTSSTRLMVITTTSAAALAAGSALQGFAPAERTEALFLLTLLAGVLMVVAGVLRLGRYTRFVSLSVMLGFLTGVAANIVLGQVGDLTGAEAEGDVALTRALDVVLHPSGIDVSSLLVGAVTFTVLLLLMRTRLASYASVAALLIPSALAVALPSVVTVADIGDIPTGVPLPHLPPLRLLFSPAVLSGAVVIAVIVLVQGAGVAEAAPNPDGTQADTNGDFRAQGIANLAAGLFRGQPVGGSVGQTALNAAAGARTRWASIFSGVWMLAILSLFSGLVGRVAMPTLAAILIFAAVSSVKVDEIRMVVRTGASSVIAMVTTFLATLFLPIAAAVGIGVALSLLLQLNKEALDLQVVSLVPQADGHFQERPAPTTLAGDEVALLDVYGSLYYAGARTLAARLPDPRGAVSPVVVLRLRGRTTLGVTSLKILSVYAGELEAAGGRLFLSGVAPALLERFRHAGQAATERIKVFSATDLVGESSAEAYRTATEWRATRAGDSAR